MILELSPEERDALLEILDREIADLGPEIRRTQTLEYRDDLKVRRQVIQNLVGRMAVLEPR